MGRASGAVRGSAVTLLDKTFTRPALERSLGRTPFTVVHLAAQGEFTGDPKGSFVLTRDGRLDMDELQRPVQLSR